MLVGCDYKTDLNNCLNENTLLVDQNEKLKSDLADMTIKNDKRVATEKTQHYLAYIEACGFMIPICNENILKQGRDAVKAGVRVDQHWYHVYLFLKLMTLAIVFALFCALFYSLYLWWLKPEKEETEGAIAVVKGAELEAAKLIDLATHKVADSTANLSRLDLQQDELQKKINGGEKFLIHQRQKINENNDTLKEQERRIKVRQEILEKFKYPFEK